MRNKEIFISNLIIVTRYAIYRNSSFLIRLESALFPTPFQFRSFRSLSPFFRIRPNRGKHLEKDILFYQFPAKADPSVRFSLPPPFVFLPPNHAIRIETITIPFPVHISSISFTNFPPFPLLLPRQESGGISAQDMFSLRRPSLSDLSPTETTTILGFLAGGKMLLFSPFRPLPILFLSLSPHLSLSLFLENGRKRKEEEIVVFNVRSEVFPK